MFTSYFNVFFIKYFILLNGLFANAVNKNIKVIFVQIAKIIIVQILILVDLIMHVQKSQLY